MLKILIIEDELALADILQDWFHEKGFDVIICHEGIEGYENALRDDIDVIISDVMLPGMDGITLVKKTREMKVKTPILILTAKNGLQDKLQGFQAGAEDYLTKPFEIEELDARIKVLLKKCGLKSEVQENNRLHCKDFTLDEITHELCHATTKRHVKLSVKEYTLLRYFMENYNQLLTKEQITIRIWGYDADVSYNNEEVYISFLRKKMRFIETKTKIVTIRGVGYQLKEEK